jgi:hypothetical protein
MVTRLTKKHGGVRKPEYRMSVMMFSTPLIAVGMFWYGWSAKAKTHWLLNRLAILMSGLFRFSELYQLELECWDSLYGS